jgi:hypothetical protein
MSFDILRAVVSPNEAVAFYRLYAAHCVEMARHISDPENKATLLVMAQAWLTLADQAQKYGETTLVYETPPRPQTQHVAQQQQQPQSKSDNGK